MRQKLVLLITKLRCLKGPGPPSLSIIGDFDSKLQCQLDYMAKYTLYGHVSYKYMYIHTYVHKYTYMCDKRNVFTCELVHSAYLLT